MLRMVFLLLCSLNLLAFGADTPASQCKSAGAVLDSLLQVSEAKVLGKENFSELARAFDHSFPGDDPRKMAHSDYLGLGYKVMNKALREDNPKFTADVVSELEEKMIYFDKHRRVDPNYNKYHRARSLVNAHHLEKLFENGFSLEPGITLHRALALKPDELPVAGQIWTDPAFVSTSIKHANTMFIGEANGYSTKKLTVVMKIVNRGFKGKVLPGSYSDKAAEYEIILPRNTPMKILSVKREGKVVEVEAEI